MVLFLFSEQLSARSLVHLTHTQQTLRAHPELSALLYSRGKKRCTTHVLHGSGYATHQQKAPVPLAAQQSHAYRPAIANKAIRKFDTDIPEIGPDRPSRSQGLGRWGAAEKERSATGSFNAPPSNRHGCMMDCHQRHTQTSAEAPRSGQRRLTQAHQRGV